MLLFNLSILVTLLVISLKSCEAAKSIIGGEETQPGEIKYQISIQYVGIQWCGGSIIDEQYIITAAHCICEDNEFLNTVPFRIVAGIDDINNNYAKKVEADIDKVYIPAVYNQSVKSTPGDIAVIKLKKKLNLAAHPQLSKVNLPPATSDRKREPSYAGKEALVSGFGWDQIKVTINGTHKDEDGSTSGKLLKAKTLVVNNIKCQSAYKSLAIHNSQICAAVIQQPKDIPQGICSGDSGGPLVIDNKLIGVVSFNLVGCNEQQKPAVYTRVSSYINFIENAKKDHITKNMRTAKWSYN